LKRLNKINLESLPIFVISVLFLIYVFLALFFNHSLFRGTFYFVITIGFILLFTIYCPINASKKVSFKDLTKSIFGFLPFLLASILFLFIQATKMIKDLNLITTINQYNIANSVVFLFIIILPFFIFSYLSDNIKNKKLSNLVYRMLIFSMLFFICIIISLFGSLVVYYTYIPGP